MEARRLTQFARGGGCACKIPAGELEQLVAEAGLRSRSVHGIRIFADVAPAALVDIDPRAVADLIALERAAAEDPAYASIATGLHVLADAQ